MACSDPRHALIPLAAVRAVDSRVGGGGLGGGRGAGGGGGGVGGEACGRPSDERRAAPRFPSAQEARLLWRGVRHPAAPQPRRTPWRGLALTWAHVTCESQSGGSRLGAASRRALAAQGHRPIFGRVGKRACAGRRAARGKEGKGERGKEGEREREGGRGREGEGGREIETDRNEKFSEMRHRDLCNNFFERNSQT